MVGVWIWQEKPGIGAGSSPPGRALPGKVSGSALSHPAAPCSLGAARPLLVLKDSSDRPGHGSGTAEPSHW